MIRAADLQSSLQDKILFIYSIVTSENAWDLIQIYYHVIQICMFYTLRELLRIICSRVLMHRMWMQHWKARPYRFWFHTWDIAWGKYALRECTLQAKPWDDSTSWSLWGYEEWNLELICKVIKVPSSTLLFQIFSQIKFLVFEIDCINSPVDVHSLCVKGYLAARRHMDGIINTVLLMLDSGLPCFSRGDPIGNLRKRFHPEMSEREAANFMIRVCTDAYNKWTTAGYDLIQYLQQGIEK